MEILHILPPAGELFRKYLFSENPLQVLLHMKKVIWEKSSQPARPVSCEGREVLRPQMRSNGSENGQLW